MTVLYDPPRPRCFITAEQTDQFCSRKPHLTSRHHVQKLFHVYRLEGNLQAQEDQAGRWEGPVQDLIHHPKDPEL